MKYFVLFLILVQMVLVIGCGGTAGQTSTSTVVNEITTTLTRTTTENKPPLKPPPSRTGARPSPSLTAPPTTTTTTPTPLEFQKVLNLGVMVHLEGWDDANQESKFRVHAAGLREYATLFEKYGAKLTLESKEMTDGAVQWDDNVLLEMQNRGHAVGVHADVGGNSSETVRQMEIKLTEMKSHLESLDVTVRHVSGVSSRCDWVTAVADTGFEFVTGTVAFALASLPPQKQPITIPDGAKPGQYHEAYPFTLEGRLLSWRAENGSNWIDDTPTGKIVIIPSGGGLAYAYEESQGQTGLAGDQQFTAEDISAFENQLKDILAYIKSNKSTQPYTYYLSWSYGKAFDYDLLEQWLKMVDKYVDSGQVRWQTIPEMYDDYTQWEIDSGRRN